MLGLAAGAAAEEPAPPERDPAREVLPRRPGPSEPQRYVPPPPDPSQVPPPTAAAPREALPVPDRWRIMRALGMQSSWIDPYNQNLLKGDLPVVRDWFVNVGVVSDTLFEFRALPTPVGPQASERPDSLDVFGRGKQSTFAQTVVLSLAAIKGDTTFKPPDYEVRLVPVLNFNRSEVEELRALRVDPRQGRTRDDDHVGLQEAFVDVHLRDVSVRYDFDSAARGHPAVHLGLPRLPLQRRAARRAPVRHARQQPLAIQPRVVPPPGEGHELGPERRGRRAAQGRRLRRQRLPPGLAGARLHLAGAHRGQRQP
jgi:hypothetical protein